MHRILLLTLLTVVSCAPSSSPDLSGLARVTDGDSLAISGKRIRLFGIDAPESQQTCTREGVDWLCGAEAAQKLRQLTDGATLDCLVRDKDRYGRFVAVCTAAGVDINEAMVASGMALAYRQYSQDYVAAEDAAHGAKLGLWAGEFVEPWNWRKGMDSQGEPLAGDCPIKGNINSKGDKIYHLPGKSSYAGTKINQAKGERWFCSEDEAIAAGWRAPLGR